MSYSDEFPPLTPVNFFQISCDCHALPHPIKFPSIDKKNFKHYLLPDTSEYCAEDSFAEVALGWNTEGVEACVKVNVPFKQAYYPGVERGDSVELFFDTRDVKSASFNTRFCHHFFFLAEAVDGKFAGEATHFRTEDTHPLCDPKDLKVSAVTSSRSYQLNIFIPNRCLIGYDPEQFNRIGFSYRINRSEGRPQHFSVVSEDYQIDQQPSLWASLKLVK